MRRDFTYIDDIVEGIVKLLPKAPSGDPHWDGNTPDPASSFAPYKIYNIGNNKPVDLLYMIEALEKALNKKAFKNFMPIQPGDVVETFADVDDLMKAVQFKPSTSLEVGIESFVAWYLEYYKIGK